MIIFRSFAAIKIYVSYRLFNCILVHFILYILPFLLLHFIPLPVFIFYSFFFFFLFYLLFFHVHCTGVFLPFLFLYSILFLSTRFPCSLYQRGWDCTAWWISPCVGVSLCVDVRLCRVSSCAWPACDALVSSDLASGV